MMTAQNPNVQQKVDSIYRAVGIDTDHDKIHNGLIFTTFDRVTLGAAGIRNILIITPPTIQSHTLLSVSGLSAGTADIYEDATVSANGTALPKINKNRAYTNAIGDTLFYHTPTITGDGTLMDPYDFSSGKHAGGTTGFAAEWVLGPNKKYMVRIISDGASNRIIFKGSWYEVDV